MMVSQEMAFVGIDVSKHDFVAAIHGATTSRTYTNDPVGFARLKKHLARLRAPVRIALEPTGGYELDLWIALDEAGFHVRQVCAAHIKAFRDSFGARAKTDRIDATMIAAYLAERPDSGRALPSRNIRRIKALAAKRRQLVHSRKALLCQEKQHTDGDILAMTCEMIELHDIQIKELNILIADLVAADEILCKHRDLLRTFPGVGPVVLTTLLTEMPELGMLKPGQASALAGLAPVTRQSGQWKGKSFVQGGRVHVRSAMFIAARFAAKIDPHFKAFADRLFAKGKPYKLVITAVARKLIEAANIVIKRGEPWESRPA